jgi:hypothetical protein
VHDFESFIYLDVPRTGSTFIKGILRRNCTTPQIGKPGAHTVLSQEYDASKFCFISVRDPLDLYLSLYSLGRSSKGLFRSLQAAGFGDLYDGGWTGFRKWLKFVLTPRNAAYIGPEYARCGNGRVCELMGWASFQIARLAIPDHHRVLGRCRERDDIRAEFRSRKAYQFTIRYENLRTDLAELLKTRLRPYLKDLDKALEAVETRDAPNPSNRPIKDPGEPVLESDLRRMLKEREWLMCEEFGYRLERREDRNSSGAEPARSRVDSPVPDEDAESTAEVSSSALQV